jgi:beta-N-acetylhexosaminidase
MVLICNQPEQADAILEAQQAQPLDAHALRRVEALRAQSIAHDPRRIHALRAQLHHWLAARQAATA